MITVGDIIQEIETFAPPYLAEDWDPIGLAIGNRQQEVKKIMVALDLDANTLAEAQGKGVDFIFTHHPAIFGSLKTLNEDDPRRRQYIALIRSNIALYSAHTNVDAARDGMNDWLAEALALERPYQTMTFSHQETFKKLSYYMKSDQMEKDYEWVKNELGSHAKLYDIVSDQEAMKIEMILAASKTGSVIQKLYELEKEPNFHLTTIDKEGVTEGIGRVGTLPKSLSMIELVKKVKKAYAVDHLRFSNLEKNPMIKTVAILGGSGEKYYQQALAQDADVYITGDISYHGAQDMIRDGLAFIDPGHFIEHIFVEKMTALLNEWNESKDWGIEIIPASQQHDVFRFK